MPKSVKWTGDIRCPLMKCGYCGEILTATKDILENLPKIHQCFKNFNQDTQGIEIDKCMTVKIVNLVPSREPVLMTEADIEEAIICEVRKRPQLYDSTNVHVKERSKLKLKDVWNEIANCISGGLTGKEVQERWGKLRNLYLVARREENAYVASGSAAKKKKKERFMYMQQMEFLEDGLIIDRTVCSLSPLETEDAAETDAEIIATTVDEREEDHRELVKEFEDSVADIMNNITRKPDGVDGFLTVVCNEIRKLPPRKQVAVQIDLLSFTKDLVQICNASNKN